MNPNPFAALKAANRMPSPPVIAMRVLELVEDEDASLEDLTRIIGTDPALIAKIMKYVNSPLMGLGFHGSSIEEAVARIGMRGAQMLALSFSVVSQKHRSGCPSFNFDNFWSESLATGVAARAFARRGLGWNVEEAFVTGLVARLGKLVFATGMPVEYEPVIGAQVRPELSLEAREREILGVDNIEMGTSLLMHWHLPEGIWRPVGGLGTEPHSELPLARPAAILLVADMIGQFVAVDSRRTSEALEEIVRTAQRRLELDRESVKEILAQVSSEWLQHGQLMEVSTRPAPDLDVLEQEAEELKHVLGIAAEVEVQSLRKENEQLSELADRDRLTGILNRGAFDEALAEMLVEANKGGAPFALILIDVDHFKSVNDTYGHPAGDEVLRSLARVINDTVRKRDSVYRYGGEEFAVLAPARSRDGAIALAECLRAAIEAAPCSFDGRRIPVTASAGVALSTTEPTDSASLIASADRRLYLAKQSGRNCCRSEDAPSPVQAKPKGLFSRLGRMLPVTGK